MERPGGGIEEGETYVESALRELREEAGIDIGPGQVDQARWRRTVPFRHRRRRLQHEVVAPSSVLTLLRPTSMGVVLTDETEDYVDFRLLGGGHRHQRRTVYLVHFDLLPGILPVRLSMSRSSCGPDEQGRGLMDGLGATFRQRNFIISS